MPFLELLFSFDGRISAAKFRQGGTIAGLLIVALFTGLTLLIFNVGAAADADTKMAAMVLGSAVLVVFTVWSNAALQAKRLHDRGRSGYLALISVFLFLMWASLFVVVGQESMVTQGGAHEPSANFLSVLDQFGQLVVPLTGVSTLVSVWMAIDLGWLPSVSGPNQYGPEPGAPGAGPVSGGPSNTDAASAPRKSWFAPKQSTKSSGPSWDVSGAESAIAKAIAERNSTGAAAAGETWKENTQAQLSNASGRSAFGRRI